MIMKYHLMKDSFIKMIGLKQFKSKCYLLFIPHYTLIKCSPKETKRTSFLYVYQSSPSECTKEELTLLLVKSVWHNLLSFRQNLSQRDSNGLSIKVKSQNKQKLKLPLKLIGIKKL